MTSFSRLSSGVKKSVLPTIPESPNVKVHCLSSDSESKGDDLSDPKVVSCELRFQSTMSNRKLSQSDGAGHSDSRYPNLTQATHDEDGGIWRLSSLRIQVMRLPVKRSLGHLSGLHRRTEDILLILIVTLLPLRLPLVSRFRKAG